MFVALMITGVGISISILLLSSGAMAFVAGDKVKLAMNSKMGPFTVEKCEDQNSQNVCKLKELGYFVESALLKKHDAKNLKMADAKDEDSTVGVQMMGR